MKIVNEINKYLNPNKEFDYNILRYFLEKNLKSYFNINDKYEITINLQNKSLEITNLSTLEEFIIIKQLNKIDFFHKNNGELLFSIQKDDNEIKSINNNIYKTITNDEKYSLIINIDKIYTLSDIKINNNGKHYFELKIQPDNISKVITLNYNDENKYEVIFNYLENILIKENNLTKENNKVKEKNRIRKRGLNLF